MQDTAVPHARMGLMGAHAHTVCPHVTLHLPARLLRPAPSTPLGNEHCGQCWVVFARLLSALLPDSAHTSTHTMPA